MDGVVAVAAREDARGVRRLMGHPQTSLKEMECGRMGFQKMGFEGIDCR